MGWCGLFAMFRFLKLEFWVLLYAGWASGGVLVTDLVGVGRFLDGLG